MVLSSVALSRPAHSPSLFSNGSLNSCNTYVTLVVSRRFERAYHRHDGVQNVDVVGLSLHQLVEDHLSATGRRG